MWIAFNKPYGVISQLRPAGSGRRVLRLVRIRVGRFELGSLAPGAWRELTARERALLF